MSRREEVDVLIMDVRLEYTDGDALTETTKIAKSLADDVDERDAIIDKLLAMLEPGVSPPKSHASCDCVECRQYEINEERYARACEITGRVKT